MTHLDPDRLALLGLGEDASASDRLHLAGCAECRAEVARFARPVAASRSTEEGLETPSTRVWAGIAAELGVDPALVGDVRPAGAPRPVVPIRRRRLGRRGVVAIAAAAAVLLVGGIGAAVLAVRNQPQQLATATLNAFPKWPGTSGTAVLERLPDGRVAVQVTTDVRPDGSTDHEVWLMTAGAKRLVSLGLLTGSSGTFVVPSDVDITRFRLVDVSDEPRDGNPAHSGDSIVRGALRS